MAKKSRSTISSPTFACSDLISAQDLLDETVTIERVGVVTFEEDPATGYSLSFQWAL